MDAASSIDRAALQRVVAVINGKGGVGKTTLTANIGGLLAASGWRVLLVDLDSQANLGLDFGYKDTDVDDDGMELSKAIIYPTQIAQPSKNIRPGLDVLIGGPHIESAAAALVSRQSSGEPEAAQLAIANLLAPIAGEYDIVLLDCPPSNDTMQATAVAAARYVLIPVKTEKASLGGLKITASRLAKVYRVNPDIDLLGVVLFASGTQSTAVRADFIEQAIEVLGGDANTPMIFTPFVRHAEATAKALRDKGLLAHELDEKVQKAEKWWVSLRNGTPSAKVGPESAKSVADDMQAITSELVRRITEIEERESVEAQHV